MIKKSFKLLLISVIGFMLTTTGVNASGTNISKVTETVGGEKVSSWVQTYQGSTAICVDGGLDDVISSKKSLTGKYLSEKVLF